MSIFRRAITVSLTLTALVVASVLIAAPASAVLTLSGSFGSATSTVVDPEPLSEPENIALNESSGELYVIDRANARVEEFNETGEYLGQFNGSATTAGSFAFEPPTGVDADPSGVAVDSSTSGSDPSAGDVYVLDDGHHVIDKFTSAGVLLSEIKDEPGSELMGVTVDSSGELWVDEGTTQSVVVRKFNDAMANAEIARLPGSAEQNNYGLAVDADGHYYTGKAKYSPEGAFEGYIYGHGPIADGLAVDPVSGLVYSFEIGRKEENESRPFTDSLNVWDTTGMVPGGDAGATLLEESYLAGEGKIVGKAGEGGYGIAVNGLAGKVFVTDMHNEDVDVLSFPILPGVTGVSESNVQTTSAMLSGEVNPVGRDANTIEFEYGTTGAYGSTVAATPSDAGSGTSPVPVSVSLTGLLPNTVYHYRMVVSNENGTVSSADKVFRTVLVGASVNDKPAFASEIEQFTATLNGTVNPGGGVASYRFLYGPTSSYGSSIPVPEGFTPINYADDPVSEQLTGLHAGTTYHFALQATNSGGTVTGPDQTFTTLPVPPPTLSTGATGAVTRGEALLSGTIDPQGWNTSYRFEYGTSTAYGSSWPSVDVELGAFTSAQPVSVTVLNLQPGTTYHYRLVATNAGGTSYGADMTFTTATYPASAILEAPILTASLGFFNPETNKSTHARKAKTKSKGKTKSKAKGKRKRKKPTKKSKGKKASRYVKKR